LNADTYIGAVNLATSTDYATTSGTHWALETLSDGYVALKNLGSHNNPNFVYLNGDTYTIHVNLTAGTGASGTHWEIDLLQIVEGQDCLPSMCP